MWPAPLVLSLLGVAAISVDATRVDASAKAQGGKCSAADIATVQKIGGGNSDSSFPALTAACGSDSWSVFRGWKHDVFGKCMNEKVGISGECASCFSESGEYGLRNCKLACLSSWCSEKCLACVNEDRNRLVACAGFTPPPAAACDKTQQGAVLAEAEAVLVQEHLGGGRCNRKDMAAMRRKGGGHADGSFPALAASCGSKSWSLFKGWQPGLYTDCLTAATGISSGCATCFSDSGKFGFQHCKAACLSSWCSSRCLECIDEYKKTLHSCVGAMPPDASEC